MQDNGGRQCGGEAGEDPGSFGDDAIRKQLGRILASSEFHATEKMRSFLRFVVEEKLAGRSHRLKGYTIAVEVFERGDDFDATYDPVVRIQAGRLRRALERYYLVAGVQDAIVIDIPKGGYVPRFTAKPATPQVANSPSAPDSDELPVTTGPRLAVLPFENLTRDPEQLVLTVGLTEELITELTRFQDIVVVPCQPARRPQDAPSDPAELAKAVGARFVLRGAVRRDAEIVKVSTRLTDTKDGRQIWADAHSHPAAASELIATQEQIAKDVVSAIASEYGIIARHLSAESRKKPPAELATYEAMLRYYSHQISPTPESAATCFASLQSAAEREPDYGPIWSALATLHSQLFVFGAPGSDDALGRTLEYAQRGVVLEPGSQLAHLILAYADHLADDFDGARKETRIALELNPNSQYAIGVAGYIHVLRGELELGMPLLDRAIAANPCHPAWFHAGQTIHHLLQKDYESALDETRTHLPFISFWDDVFLASILGKLGRIKEAGVHVERANRQKADLTGRVHELMRRSLKIDSLVEDLLDGLRKAGMPDQAAANGDGPVTKAFESL